MSNKYFCTIMLFFLLNDLSGQEFYPAIHKKYNWNTNEKNDNRVILDFVNNEKGYLKQFRQNDPYTPKINDLIKSLHLIDLDKDGIDEIVFNGASGGEGNETQIFQKINNRYELIFTERQNIDDIKMVDNKLKIYICDYGCCAEYTAIQKIFKMNVKNKRISFEKIYQSILYNQSKRPDSLFDNPIRFKINVDNYKLRYAPRFEDSTFQIWDTDDRIVPVPVGNVIANLPKNALGYALGFKTDKSGRQWWFVEIDENTSLRNLKLYMKDKFPTRVIGWTSSNYLQRL